MGLLLRLMSLLSEGVYQGPVPQIDNYTGLLLIPDPGELDVTNEHPTKYYDDDDIMND